MRTIAVFMPYVNSLVFAGVFPISPSPTVSQSDNVTLCCIKMQYRFAGPRKAAHAFLPYGMQSYQTPCVIAWVRVHGLSRFCSAFVAASFWLCSLDVLCVIGTLWNVAAWPLCYGVTLGGLGRCVPYD